MYSEIARPSEKCFKSPARWLRIKIDNGCHLYKQALLKALTMKYIYNDNGLQLKSFTMKCIDNQYGLQPKALTMNLVD